VHCRRVKGKNGILESVLIGLRANVAGTRGWIVLRKQLYPLLFTILCHWFSRSLPFLSPLHLLANFSASLFTVRSRVRRSFIVDTKNASIVDYTRVHSRTICTFMHLMMPHSFCLRIQCRRLRWSGRERRRNEVKGSQTDIGLASDCVYSSTKRFTFTKSFQLHGARRISTLLSYFRDVILLLAIVERCKQERRLLSLPHSVPSSRNDFKVVAENRFANPRRRRIEPLSYSSTSISFCIASTQPCLFLSPVIYNGFSLFFSEVRKFCWLPKLVAIQRCCIIAYI